MRRAWNVALTIVMGCGTLIAAQDARPQQPPPATTTAAPKAITMVTGCVQRAEGATGTTGATASAARTEFTLTNAMISSPGASGSASTTTGTSSTTTGAASTTGAANAPAAAATSGSTYMLDDPSNKLTAHVGHKVEVSGTLAPAAGGGASATASAGGASASATSRPAGRLQVTDVRMISADCSAR